MASGSGHLVHGAVTSAELDRVGEAVSMVTFASSSLPKMESSLSKMGSHTD